ncbi:Protein of unknown function [Gryllus bimaculatus]|nr:Protein of unknown function [Gryllus bimaculatus]
MVCSDSYRVGNVRLGDVAQLARPESLGSRADNRHQQNHWGSASWAAAEATNTTSTHGASHRFASLGYDELPPCPEPFINGDKSLTSLTNHILLAKKGKLFHPVHRLPTLKLQLGTHDESDSNG